MKSASKRVVERVVKMKSAAPCGAVMRVQSEVAAWAGVHECKLEKGHDGMHLCKCGTFWGMDKGGGVKANIVYPIGEG